MELDITDFFDNADAFDYSASIAERGEHAGRITWGNAVADSKRFMMPDSPDKFAAVCDFLAGFGAWKREELEAMPATELNALLIQFIAGDIRGFEDVAGADWSEYTRLCEAGVCSGRMYQGDDGRVYYYIGA